MARQLLSISCTGQVPAFLASASHAPGLTIIPHLLPALCGRQDFANASLSAAQKVVSGDLARLPAMKGWVDEHEAFVKEVSKAMARGLFGAAPRCAVCCHR